MTADAVWEQRDPRIDEAMPALVRLVIAVHHPDHATSLRDTDAALDDAVAILAGPDHQPPGWRALAIVLAAMVPTCVPWSQLLGWTENRDHYHALLRDGMHSCHASTAAYKAAQTAEAQRVAEQRHADWMRHQPVVRRTDEQLYADTGDG